MIESSCVHTSLISRTSIFIETQQPNTTTKPKKKKTKQTNKMTQFLNSQQTTQSSGMKCCLENSA